MKKKLNTIALGEVHEDPDKSNPRSFMKTLLAVFIASIVICWAAQTAVSIFAITLSAVFWIPFHVVYGIIMVVGAYRYTRDTDAIRTMGV
ncbi:MAG: hypothetical protein ACXADL_05915 [Candidatus Thorarchaeota archaeon]|jgi:hypothetical protein